MTDTTRSALEAARDFVPAAVKEQIDAALAEEQQAGPTNDALDAAIHRMSTPLDTSRLSGATAEADARCMSTIRDGVAQLRAAVAEARAKALEDAAKACEGFGRYVDVSPTACADAIRALQDQARHPLQAEERESVVTCGCGDEFPANSYDAGFLHAAGHCANCHAAKGGEPTEAQINYDAVHQAAAELGIYQCTAKETR